MKMIILFNPMGAQNFSHERVPVCSFINLQVGGTPTSMASIALYATHNWVGLWTVVSACTQDMLHYRQIFQCVQWHHPIVVISCQ
nr:hypothetical protein Iba_scaffold11380CG0010 [Ipomoea batatas]GME11166.1 hypothetical protein Iba_scaffold11380CG0020 [Ipomoea batatas]